MRVTGCAAGSSAAAKVRLLMAERAGTGPRRSSALQPRGETAARRICVERPFMQGVREGT